MKASNSKQPETVIRVLKHSVCQSISGRSNLVYEIGIDEKKDLHLRIVKNSGRGMFNKDWISLQTIQAVLDKPKGGPITSNVLLPLRRGVSVNTTGFLWAALVHVGMVAPSNTKRGYDRVEPARFNQEVQALIEGSPLPAKETKSKVKAVNVSAKPSPTTKKKK